MSTDAFVGNIILFRGDRGSPENFTPLCETFGISGLGEANEQIDATTFCSGGFKEFIAGLAEGTEFNLELNFIAKDVASRALQTQMIADVKAKAIGHFELRAYPDGYQNGAGVATLTFHVSATCLSWTLNPSPSAKNGISFGLKVTGTIDISAP